MNRSCSRKQQKGLTLIELMIALGMGVFVIGSALSFFISTQQTSRLQQAISSIQSNGQYIINKVTFDLRMAGYSGCYPGLSSDVENLLNSPTNFAWNLSNPVFGYNAVANTDTIGGISDFTAGSDVLVLKGMGEGINLSADSDVDNITIDDGDITFSEGQILLVTDCNNASLFQVNSVSTTSGTTTLTHTAASMVPGNASGTMANSFANDAEVAPLITYMYYLAEGNNGRSAFHLAQLEATTGTTASLTSLELIPDVKDMQFYYGVDTNGDLNVDEYQDASAVSDWADVISIRVALLVASSSDALTGQATSYSFDANTFNYTKDSTAQTGADKRMKKVFIGFSAIRNRMN